MVVALWRAPWATAHATDLMVDLSESRVGALRDRLAQALGDPGLAVGLHVDGAFVDAAGERIELPPPASGRRATVIERKGRPVAVLIHDRAVLEDPGLRTSLAEAADLASSNAALEGELRTQIAQLRESRRRLVVAADEERRRLERRLQETAERRLARLLDELSAPRPAPMRTPSSTCAISSTSRWVTCDGSRPACTRVSWTSAACRRRCRRWRSVHRSRSACTSPASATSRRRPPVPPTSSAPRGWRTWSSTRRRHVLR
jgi:hypothetical protein